MQQNTLSRTEKVRNKQLTPIEKLLADKIDIEEKCRKQENKLNDDFAYIQNNASSILLSGVSTLLFPKKSMTDNSKKQSPAIAGSEEGNAAKSSLSISDYAVIAKSLLPVAWEIIQPIIVTWGIKKAKSYIFGLFAGKKRTSTPK